MWQVFAKEKNNRINVKMSWWVQRHCGFSVLCLWSSSVSGSSLWQCKMFSVMCFWDVLASVYPSQNRADKKRLNIIIVAEGAIDCHNKAITPDYIKDVSMVEKPDHPGNRNTHFMSSHHGFLQSFVIAALIYHAFCVVMAYIYQNTPPFIPLFHISCRKLKMFHPVSTICPLLHPRFCLCKFTSACSLPGTHQHDRRCFAWFLPLCFFLLLTLAWSFMFLHFHNICVISKC